MPAFKCSKCGCVENTALCFYHVRKPRETPPLCSECDPKIGVWHGSFPKRPATGLILASDGFLYGPKDVESDSFKWRMANQGLRVIGDA